MRFTTLSLAFAAITLPVLAQAPKVDLEGYRSVDKAQTTKLAATAASAGGQTGYLGVAVMRDSLGKLLVEEVQPDSPGAKAGIKKGDVVLKVEGRPVATLLAFREWLQASPPGAAV